MCCRIVCRSCSTCNTFCISYITTQSKVGMTRWCHILHCFFSLTLRRLLVVLSTSISQRNIEKLHHKSYSFYLKKGTATTSNKQQQTIREVAQKAQELNHTWKKTCALKTNTSEIQQTYIPTYSEQLGIIIGSRYKNAKNINNKMLTFKGRFLIGYITVRDYAYQTPFLFCFEIVVCLEYFVELQQKHFKQMKFYFVIISEFICHSQ